MHAVSYHRQCAVINKYHCRFSGNFYKYLIVFITYKKWDWGHSILLQLQLFQWDWVLGATDVCLEWNNSACTEQQSVHIQRSFFFPVFHLIIKTEGVSLHMVWKIQIWNCSVKFCCSCWHQNTCGIKNARLKVCWAVTKLVNEQVYSNFIIVVWCDIFSIDISWSIRIVQEL